MKLQKLTLISFLISISAHAAVELKLDTKAPDFKVKNQKNENFDLNKRKGKWTVLYFYPKAETPGCTKQACAFRDNIKKIESQGASVYGISMDTVEAQAAFHKNHSLNFDLLADANGKIAELYGSKMPDRMMSRRWTFIIDPELKIKAIEKDVDPAFDSERVAKEIEQLKAKK
jgi:peroxiredoxin Q/BCP